MRKVVAALAAAVLLLAIMTGCIMPDYPASGISGNPFLKAIDLTEPGVIVTGTDEHEILVSPFSGEGWDGSSLIFPVITDVHVDKRGVNDNQGAFYSFLEENDFPFVICLGDISNNGDYTEDGTVRFISGCLERANGNFLYAIGNHDRFRHDAGHFDRFFSAFVPSGHNPRIGRYVFGPVSIYKLDNSIRAYGSVQLGWLEEALRQDTNPVKILVAHVNHMSGGTAGETLYMTGITDIYERNDLLRIMDENDVSLMLTGHHHDGGYYRISDDRAEINLSPLFGREDRGGHWYTAEVVPGDKLIITPYSAETGIAGTPWTIPL